MSTQHNVAHIGVGVILKKIKNWNSIQLK